MYSTNITPPQIVLDKFKGGATWPIYMFDSMTDAADSFERLKKAKGSNWQQQYSSDFTGNKGTSDTIKALRDGDMTAVAASDKLLNRFEEMLAVSTSKFTVIDDVAGAVPNVPAYLAGHPLTMRRRQRIASELAPLTLVIDTCVSAGLNQKQIMERGVAILALVRALSLVRPIQLYVGWNLGSARKSSQTVGAFVKIDTAPIDLARAAYPITHPSFLRVFGFEYVGNSNENCSVHNVPWGFNSADLVRKALPEQMQKILEGEVFCVPGMHAEDRNKNKPVAWLYGYLKEYGGEAFQNLPDPETVNE